jgi:hypothetical protein
MYNPNRERQGDLKIDTMKTIRCEKKKNSRDEFHIILDTGITYSYPNFTHPCDIFSMETLKSY